jgi:DNA-binding transcriptional ArsR family regulator
MSGEAIGWAFRKVQMDDPTTKLVLVALCNHANHEDEAWPANSVLCQTTGLSKRAVQNSLKKLEEWGLITRVRRSRDNGSDTSSMVYIDLDYGWTVKDGVARRAPGAPHARLGVQEVQGEGAPHAPLETTLKQQEETPIVGVDDFFTAEHLAKKNKRRSTIPAEYPMTDRHKEYAAERGIVNGRAVEVFEAFKNHHAAKGSVMLDWDAAWRTWVGNEIKFSKGRMPDPPRSPPRPGMIYGDDYM